MIRNPYPAPKEDDKASCRFQTYLNGEDKGLLFSVRPIRGTPQAVINHLIKNLCDELRELGITEFSPDADDIFTILVERRPLNGDQLARLRRTTLGSTKQVSERIQQYRRRSAVRQGLADPQISSHNTEKQTAGRVKQNRKGKTNKKAHSKSNDRG